MFHGRDLFPDFVQKRQDLRDGAAVFPLEFIDRRETRFHFFQPARVGFQPREVIAQCVRGFLQAQAGGFQILAQGFERRIDAA